MSKETIRIALEDDAAAAREFLGADDADDADDDAALLRAEVAQLNETVAQLRADVDRLLTINRRSVVLGGLWID